VEGSFDSLSIILRSSLDHPSIIVRETAFFLERPRRILERLSNEGWEIAPPAPSAPNFFRKFVILRGSGGHYSMNRDGDALRAAGPVRASQLNEHEPVDDR
jgi:hypothetical protein